MSQLQLLTQKIYQDSFIPKDEGVSFVIDPGTIIAISSLIIQLIKIIYDCNKSKLSQSVFHSPRTLEKVWLLKKIKQLLPQNKKEKAKEIYFSLISKSSELSQFQIDSLVGEIFSLDNQDP